MPQIAAKAVSETLARTNVSGLIGSTLVAVLASGADRSILDRALEAVAGWLDKNGMLVGGLAGLVLHPLLLLAGID